MSSRHPPHRDQAIPIIITPTQRAGYYNARIGRRLLLTDSPQPLKDAVRLLVALGYDGNTRLLIRAEGADRRCAATRTVQQLPNAGVPESAAKFGDRVPLIEGGV